MRQAKVRKTRNKLRKSILKGALKKFEQKRNRETFSFVQSTIDKAVKWGIIKENKGARLKEKLSKVFPLKGQKINQTKKVATKPKVTVKKTPKKVQKKILTGSQGY